MDLETFRVAAEITGYVAGVVSVLFLAVQLMKERKLQEFKMLQNLEEKYTDLLWRASSDKDMNGVWEKLPEDKKQIFDEAAKHTTTQRWSVWVAMSDAEQDCYRFTRAGLEILEQAFLAKDKGWIDDKEIWGKWRGWMQSWKRDNQYVPYVLKEAKHWFTPSFVEFWADLEVY